MKLEELLTMQRKNKIPETTYTPLLTKNDLIKMALEYLKTQDKVEAEVITLPDAKSKPLSPQKEVIDTPKYTHYLIRAKGCENKLRFQKKSNKPPDCVLSKNPHQISLFYEGLIGKRKIILITSLSYDIELRIIRSEITSVLKVLRLWEKRKEKMNAIPVEIFEELGL